MGELAQLITAFAALIAAVGTIWNISRTNRVHDKVVIVGNRVANVETQTNGMSAIMNKQAEEAGHAAGVVDERERAAGEAAEKP